MGPLVSVAPWIPEDDLLLKNSIEAGASLESLAKGAVQFSRRFSIRELQDRWHGILYDPVISAEAAFRMTEFERTNPNFPTKFARTGYSKDSKCSSTKRKAEKLRSTYRSLRKKFCTESFNSLDLGFLVPPNDSQFMDIGDANHIDSLDNTFLEILGNGVCEPNHVVMEDNVAGDVSYVGGENLTCTELPGPSDCDMVHQEKLEVSGHEKKTAIASTDSYLAQLSTSLFEDVGPLDDKEVDKSYYDGLSSLLVNPTNDTNPKEVLPTAQVPSIALDVTPDDHVISEVDDTTEMNLIKCKSVSDISALDPHPEIVDGVISCSLNQEYLDIPCNDNIFLSNNCHPMSVSSLARRNFKDTNNPITSSVRDLATGGTLKVPGRSKAEIGQPSQGIKFRALTSPESLNSIAPRGSSNTLLCDGTGAKDGKKEIVGGKLIVGFDSHGGYSEKDSGNINEEKGGLAITEAPNAKNGDDGVIENSDLEQEIAQAEADEHVSESDEDLPNYSDIEAMILDMDLDPDDQDNFELEVSKYQSEEMKRIIIRLEQSAYSYMQRAMASRGALAVLYGRSSKHFIKKPRVLVGRSTEDLEVDINLGGEKHGGKISRRQAIIRLSDEDGSFYIKNLGKYPISVNEKEVDPGDNLILKSDCLLEMRGLSFIFETNQVRVKEYLKSIEKED